MACTIIESKHIKVNGGSTLYGGAITNVSFNFGGLSSGHRASITVIKQEANLATPESQDAVTVELLGLKLQMHVGGYTKSIDASSATQMTINLYDQSNKFLDHDFIVLAEEFPKESSNKNIHILGDKYGTLPHKQTAELTGSIVPDADTKWGSIRKFFKELKGPQSFLGGGGNLLDEAEVDSFVKSASGKTLYYTNRDEHADSSSKTLKEVLGDLIIGEFDNKAFDFTGSFREVIVSICNALGYFAYWDMSKQKVKIIKRFNTQAGRSLLDSISKQCNAISSLSSEDYTVTSSQSALGTFSSSDPGETSKMYGSGVTRFYKAYLLEAEFHYSTCAKRKELKVLDFENPDVLKAISAAQDGEIFAMYALQTMLKTNTADLDKLERKGKLPLPGKGNEKVDIDIDLKDQFESADAIGYQANSFLAEYYKISEKDEACEGAVFPAWVKLGTDADETMQKVEKSWNSNPSEVPCSWAGESDSGLFETANTFIHSSFNFLTILDDESRINGKNDILRHYLKAVGEFKNRFYVVTEQLGLRSVRGNAGNYDYGFYMTSSSAGPSANFNVDNGYEHIAINPYLSLKDSAGEFKALAKTIYGMYKKAGNIDDFLSKTPIVELIRALYNDELKEFTSRSYAKSTAVSQNELNDESFDQPAMNMHLIVKKKSSVEGPFSSETYTEFESKEFFDVSLSSRANSIAKKIYKFSFSKGDGVLYELFKRSIDSPLNFLVVTDEDISNEIPPALFEADPLRKLKMEYNVEGLQSTIVKSSGHFAISAADIKEDREVWRGNLVQNISINAADIGVSNDVFSKFQSTAADDSYVYSKKNQKSMKNALKAKVENNTWIDDEPASGQSLQFVLTGNIKLPGIEQGLQSLSVTSSDGNIMVNVSVGNENAKKAQIAMRKMRSEGSKLRHGYGSIIPDSTEDFSPKFIALAKGILR